MALIQFANPSFTPGSFAAALQGDLEGKPSPDNTFSACLQERSSCNRNWTKRGPVDGELVEISLYELAQEQEDLPKVIRSELTGLLRTGRALFRSQGEISGLNRDNVGWLVIQMSLKKGVLFSDSFKGL